MAKGKRSGHRADEIIAARAMKHHDFVGGADAERRDAQEQKDARVQHDHEQLEKEVVREMARELEAQAGIGSVGSSAPAAQRASADPAAAAGGPAASAPAAPRQEPYEPKAERGWFGRGLDLLEEARDNAPRAFEALRAKAEERLAGLPRPVKRVIHRGEQAAALLLAPARIGVALARELFKAPLQLFDALRRRAA